VDVELVSLLDCGRPTDGTSEASGPSDPLLLALETTAEAFIASGQFSIIPRGDLMSGSDNPVCWDVEEPCALDPFAQQSCECLAEHESLATIVSVSSFLSSGAAMTALLQPSRQPAPAIQSETLIASDSRKIRVGRKVFIGSLVYSGDGAMSR
jgi:hypothetical protein